MKKEDLDSKKLRAFKFFTKICSMCGITKTINDFHWKVLNVRLSAECASCAIDRDNTRYSSSIHAFIKMLIKNKISDCKRGKRNKFISLDHESFFKIWEQQFKKFGAICPYSGIEMTHQRGEGKIGTNASIDRFDSSLGYIPGNVVFCTNLTNSMKLDMGFEEFLNQCQTIAANRVDHSRIREYMQNLQGLRTMDHGPEDE
jgi:hypothetical protein